MSETAVKAQDARLARRSPQEVILWGRDTFGDVIVSCGFGLGTGALIDMMSRLNVSMPLIRLDTRVLHPASIELIDRLQARYHITIEAKTPSNEDLTALPQPPSLELFRNQKGTRQWCCYVRKGKPLSRALAGHSAWMNSLRADSTLTDRAEASPVAIDYEHGGMVKLCPLARWSTKELWRYVRDHEVPYHAHFDHGYGSIGGCGEPCSRPGPGRSGRWWWEDSRSEAHCGTNKTAAPLVAITL